MRETGFTRETRAEALIARRALVTSALIGCCVWVLNSTSIMMERARAGLEANPLDAWFTEGTSIVIVFGLFIAALWWERRHPFVIGQSLQTLPWHVLGALVFSVLHIVFLGLAREALYPIIVGGSYDFFSDPVQVFTYELRKDVLTYAALILIIGGYRAIEWQKMELEAVRENARQAKRLTLKCGGRTILVEANDFETGNSAGNYVELKLATGNHFARMTLAELELQLGDAGIDAVRAHRSWLINRVLISEITPTGEGDVSIKLKNGDTIPGSRRYRKRLAA